MAAAKSDKQSDTGPLPALSFEILDALGIGGSFGADPAYALGFTFALNPLPLERSDNHLSTAEMDFGSVVRLGLTPREGGGALAEPIGSPPGGNSRTQVGESWTARAAVIDDLFVENVPDVTSPLLTYFSFPLGLTPLCRDAGDSARPADEEQHSGVLYDGDQRNSVHGEGQSNNLFCYVGDDIQCALIGAGTSPDLWKYDGGVVTNADDRLMVEQTHPQEDYIPIESAAADEDITAQRINEPDLGCLGVLLARTDYLEITSAAPDTHNPDEPSGTNTSQPGLAGVITAMTPYQIADIISANATDIEAADFFQR